jgi:tetratricopeptide (TPR) repeat protein
VFTDPAVDELWHAGRFREAYEASREPDDGLTDMPFRDRHETLGRSQLWHEHGLVAWYAGRYRESEAALGHALELRRTTLGDAHPDTLASQFRHAAAVGVLDRRGVVLFERALDALGRAFGLESLEVALAHRDFSTCLRDFGDLPRARALLDLARPTIEQGLELDHPAAILALTADAQLAELERDDARASHLGQRAVGLGTIAWGPSHPFVAAAELVIAVSELRRGDAAAARKRLPDICDNLEDSYGEHPELARALWCRAACAVALKRGLRGAERDILRVVEIYRTTGLEERAAQAMDALVAIRWRMNKRDS